MASDRLPVRTLRQISDAVSAYEERRTEFSSMVGRVLEHLTSNHQFMDLIHSVKSRDKDPKHLRDKLERKARDARRKGKVFDITMDNLFARVDDLAGVRLLHLRSAQVQGIDAKLREILDTYDYKLVKKPEASSWDIETEKMFRNLNFKIISRPSLYTSVHYVVSPHYSPDRCEIQVRTLAEELWGEVSHSLNYPHETGSVACREQLLALARLTSGCTRLVDSIFASLDEYNRLQGPGA